MAKATIKRLHVNMHVIKRNQKTGEREPVYTIKNRGKTYIADDAVIHGECRAVYSPDKPMSCGARCWMETTAPVTLMMKGEKIHLQ